MKSDGWMGRNSSDSPKVSGGVGHQEWTKEPPKAKGVGS